MSKIVLGFSGGVDSTVSTMLLKKAGHEVYGLYMDNADEAARQCAIDTAEFIGVPLTVLDVKAELERNVCRPFTEAYLRGETPNPCIICNPSTKFKNLLAEADRIKRVTEATAEAEAMEKAGEGIANQRKAIALGIKDSLEIIQETGVGNDEANQLFMFTQWSEMMTEFARTGKTSTVVLPSDFSMFEQILTAGKVQNDSKE